MKPLRMELQLGEQLTGFSPTICRRAIAAIRKAHAGLNPQRDYLPEFCTGLLVLLCHQTQMGTDEAFDKPAYLHPGHRNVVLAFLDACDKFLDVVKGVETTDATTPPAPTK